MPDDSHQNAVGTGIAQALGEGAHATVNITGFTSEQIAPLLQAAGAAAQARIDELAGQLNTSSEAARGFLSILREDDVPTDLPRFTFYFFGGQTPSHFDWPLESGFGPTKTTSVGFSPGGMIGCKNELP
jgi:hypothetical protein